MSAPKLLIPLAYLNEACFLSLNNDEKEYKMSLKLAQDQLRAIIGAEFFDQISTQYDPQADTFTAANETLYEDYIKDFLAWQTYAYYIQFSQAKDTPTGAREFSEEHSTILSDIKLSARERNIADKAQFYKNHMVNFLKNAQDNDSTAYPLYEHTCKTEMSWGISSVSAKSDRVFQINKAIETNE